MKASISAAIVAAILAIAIAAPASAAPSRSNSNGAIGGFSYDGVWGRATQHDR